MSERNTDSWMQAHQFTVVILVLVFVWSTLIIFYFIKADEVTRDPCSICAERMGKDVVCTMMQTHPVSKTYYPNGSSDDNLDEVAGLVRTERKKDLVEITNRYNFTKLEKILPS